MAVTKKKEKNPNHQNPKPTNKTQNPPQQKTKPIWKEEKNLVCPESILLVMYKININISNTGTEIAGLNISNILYCTKPSIFCEKNIFFPIWKVNVLDIGTNSCRGERIVALKGGSIWIFYTTLGKTLYVDM